MIENKEKLPLKDMKPEEIKEILNTPKEYIEICMSPHLKACEWTNFGLSAFENHMILRTKPKKLTVMELYDEVESFKYMKKMVRINLSSNPLNELPIEKEKRKDLERYNKHIEEIIKEVLGLISQCEGFNIEGEE